jgi:hypothetical protein
LLAAGKDRDAVARARRAHPAGSIESMPRQSLGGSKPDRAEPHDADLAVPRAQTRQRDPFAALLRGRIGRQMAMMAQHMQERGLVHHGVAAGIARARNRHVGKLGIAQQTLGTGGKRHDQAQVGKIFQFSGRHQRHRRGLDIGGIAGLRPDAQVKLGHLGREQLLPFVGLAENGSEQQRHGRVSGLDKPEGQATR